MKLLREYIRELLTESIDPKIMSMIDKAEKLGFRGYVKSGYAAIYDPTVDVSDRPPGYVGFVNRVAGVSYNPEAGAHGQPCSAAREVSVSGSKDFGMGPLAYDLAIESSGGLMSDRLEVSDEARAVWDYYLNSRSDVQSFQLDNSVDDLTPGLEDDNCLQNSARVVAGQRKVPSVDSADSSWVKSPLSKVYRKPGTPVMDELRRRNMLDEK